MHFDNNTMTEFTSSLNDVEIDDINNFRNAKQMWEKLALVHGGYPNVLRVKVESLRGKYDDMRIKEGKNVGQYVNQIKEVISSIRTNGGIINNSKILSNDLRSLLPIYIIKVFATQEVRAMPKNILQLDNLVGWLATFELRNYENNIVKLGNSFKSPLTIDNSKKIKKCKEESGFKCEDDFDAIEAFLAIRLSRGKDKFKGKLPLSFFK